MNDKHLLYFLTTRTDHLAVLPRSSANQALVPLNPARARRNIYDSPSDRSFAVAGGSIRSSSARHVRQRHHLADGDPILEREPARRSTGRTDGDPVLERREGARTGQSIILSPQQWVTTLGQAGGWFVTNGIVGNTEIQLTVRELNINV